MKKDTLVYQHRRNDTGEIFYIGIGNEDRSYSKHQRSNWWNRVVNKHGYSVEILQTNLTWEEACKEEKRLIKLYGRKDLGLGTLVNMTDGGDGVYNPSKEIRKKMGWNKGMKWEELFTEETIEKLKESKKGENHPSSKLTEDDVLWIRENYKHRDKKYGLIPLSKMFNTTKTTIMNVVKRKNWTHI